MPENFLVKPHISDVKPRDEEKISDASGPRVNPYSKRNWKSRLDIVGAIQAMFSYVTIFDLAATYKIEAIVI